MTEFNPQLKLLAHGDALASFSRGDWKAPPVGVEISPTNHCTAKCPWCWFVSGEYKQKHSREEIPWKVLWKTIGTMYLMGVKSITWTGGGDPSLYSAIDTAIEYTNGLGFRQGIFTNAYVPLKYPEKLDWIRITVTEKFTITKHVAEYAKRTKVGVNFNLHPSNEHHLDDMVRAARDAGVAYFQVRPALSDRVEDQPTVEYPQWLEDRYDNPPKFRIVLTDYKWEDYRRRHGYPICHGHRIIPFIWHNGDVAVCAYHFGREPFVLGNLHAQKDPGDFRTLWESDRRRKMIAAGVPVIPECQHCCKLHETNKALAVMAHDVPPADDPEFI